MSGDTYYPVAPDRVLKRLFKRLTAMFWQELRTFQNSKHYIYIKFCIMPLIHLIFASFYLVYSIFAIFIITDNLNYFNLHYYNFHIFSYLKTLQKRCFILVTSQAKKSDFYTKIVCNWLSINWHFDNKVKVLIDRQLCRLNNFLT